MKSRLKSVFSHSTPRWEPSDSRSEDLSQNPSLDVNNTASTYAKVEFNERITFHINTSSSRTSPNTSQNSLLRPRKSAISLTSLSNRELDARTNFQWQSTFFAKLPLEVRQMVYAYLYESKTIHLTMGEKKDKFGRRETKFGNFICTHQHIGTCTCRIVVPGSVLEPSLPQLEVAQLGLIRTCRRMYSECIHYLYSVHSFALLHVTHLLALPKRIPQQRLDAIKVLRLVWRIRALPYMRRIGSNKLAYHEDTENWEKGWEILSKMKGLQSLSVELVDPTAQAIWETTWLALEASIMEPIKKVKFEGPFEVTLPYPTCNVEQDMGGSGVRLKKPGEVVEQP